MNAESIVSVTSNEDVRSPGEMLAQGRQRSGRTKEEVAVQLNLSVDQIQALEENRFGDLPGKTYVQGYLKAYARLVGCEEEEIFRNFNLQEDTSIRGIKPVMTGPESGGRHKNKKVWGLLVIVALGVLSFMWWQSRQQADVGSRGADLIQRDMGSISQDPDQNEVRTETRILDPSTMQSTNASLAPQDIERAQPGDELRARIEAEELSLTREQNAETAGPAAAVPQGEISPGTLADDAAAPGREAPSTPAQTSNGRTVTFEFDASSWVDLRDADGQRLLYEHINQGRQVAVEGKPPFSVFLGNAEGVRIEYDGKPFDFSAYVNGVYARFSLGTDAP